MYEEVDLITIPKQEHWSGAQIHQLITDVEKQVELTSRINIPQEVSQHYRDLLTRLIKTYGH
jgi:hypothetical protein